MIFFKGQIKIKYFVKYFAMTEKYQASPELNARGQKWSLLATKFEEEELDQSYVPSDNQTGRAVEAPISYWGQN